MKLGKKALLLAGIPVGLGLAGVLVYMFVLSTPAPPPEVPDPAEGEHGIMLPLADRVVNLADGGDFRYAKVGVTIELRPHDAAFYALAGEARAVVEEEIHLEFEPAMPMLLDAVNRIVAAETSEHLGSPEGRSELKAELLEEVRHILGEHEVLNLYFTELVMQ